jgi:hypothetical protein
MDLEKPLKRDMAYYFGGHLKYALKSGRFFDVGGTTKTGVTGELRLYDDKIEFEKSAIRASEKWKISIPFDKIIADKVGFVEKEGGKAVGVGGGLGGPSLVSPMFGGLGGGFMSKYGDKNLLVIPYEDENGINHAPSFQIKGVIRDKTPEWSEVIYNKLVETKRKKNI